jgi:hypothetical protein
MATGTRAVLLLASWRSADLQRIILLYGFFDFAIVVVDFRLMVRKL